MSAPLFPHVDLAAWRARVARELGEKPFEKLIRATLDGVAIDPLYAAESVAFTGPRSVRSASPFVLGSGSSLLNTERIAVTDPLRGNAIALEAVADGADALFIALDAAGRLGVDRNHPSASELVGKEGVAIVTVADVGTLLAGVDLTQTRVFFDAGANAVPLAAFVQAALANAPSALREGRVSVGFDPFGALARDGALPRPFAELTDEVQSFSNSIVRPLISSAPYNAAGASAVVELGLVLAAFIGTRGIGQAPMFEICASADVFLTIAKVRALKLLIAKATHALGVETEAMFIVGRTSPRTLTQRAPHTNMVRVATEAFALAISGVDALITSPFDEALGESDAGARRTARHTQLVLREESHLAKVLDPGGGSYYVEALTDDLARAAWRIMREIESEGGMLRAIVDGGVQRRIELSREARYAAIAKRKEVIVGINDYAIAGEVKLSRPPSRGAADRAHAVERAKRAALVELPKPEARGALTESDLLAYAASGAGLAAVSQTLSRGGDPERAAQLDCARDAARIEAIRDEADALSEVGPRPKAVIVCLGAAHEYRPREAFARRFFETGGMDVVSVDSPETTATRWIALRPEVASSDVVCIAGSDERYAEMGQAAILTVRSAYPVMQLVLAGRSTALARPGVVMTEHVDVDIYLGCDSVSVLASILQCVRQRRKRAFAQTVRLA